MCYKHEPFLPPLIGQISMSEKAAVPANVVAAPTQTQPAPIDYAQTFTNIFGRAQRLFLEQLERHATKPFSFPKHFDPAHISEASLAWTHSLFNDPQALFTTQNALWEGYAKIGQTAMARMFGLSADPAVPAAPSDKRFQDKDWQENWMFDALKQTYLLTAQSTLRLLQQESAKLPKKQARKLEFAARQIIDALSPSNFWLTNPEVLRTTLSSGGTNFLKGFENLLEDLENGRGTLRVSMTSPRAFKVGENLGTTPGKVVYQNELMQLIQYAPLTPSVHSAPMLIVPPWINKFYILDLREKNSFIRYLVSQGHTVFCLSWVNPDERHADVQFDDYMAEGILTALREIRRVTNAKEVNTLGYCIGGTTLACTLAYLARLTKQGKRPADLPEVASATYLVALTDFSEPGEIGVFIDEDQIKDVEDKMAERGYLEGSAMAMSFTLLRANDLLWSFVVSDYLLGREPFPFDILYWNGDSTNLPAAMQSFYLRNMYLSNKLVEPNGVAMKGVSIDLREITTPTFMLSTQEDHIALWKSTYAATQLYKGPVKFVLAGSGHIAGIINPPAANKYGYWTNDTLPASPDAWLEKAEKHAGSWWPEWIKWLNAQSGDQIPAREVKNGIEDAPGSYVKRKAG